MTTPLLDTTRLQSLKDMAGDQFATIVQSFIQSTTKNVNLAGESRKNHNHDALRRAVHSLKGSCGTLGATSLGEVAATTEAAIVNNSADVDSMLTKLVAVHGETVANLNKLLA